MGSCLFSRQTDTRRNIGTKLFVMPGESDKSDKRPRNNTGIVSLLMLRKRVQPNLWVCLNHSIPKQSPGLTVPLQIFDTAATSSLHHFVLKIFFPLQLRVKSWGKLNCQNIVLLFTGGAAALKLQMELLEATAQSHLTGLGLLSFVSLSKRVQRVPCPRPGWMDTWASWK